MAVDDAPESGYLPPTVTEAPMSLTRRDFLQLSGAAVAAHALVGTDASAAETPQRGGVFRIRGEDATSGFDPHLVANHHRIATNLSFTHSRLVKVKAGAAVVPGTQPLEPDLAESWSQPNDRTYVFKLRKGVRWHPKPPVNGRELTADDVKYTYDRFLQVKGNPNRSMLGHVEKIDVIDRYTVKFTLSEPFGWFLDYLANTVMWIVPREAVEQFGDLRRWEACIGTGPWMLERYEPNTRLTFVRNTDYFVPGLPSAARSESRTTGSRFSRPTRGRSARAHRIRRCRPRCASGPFPSISSPRPVAACTSATFRRPSACSPRRVSLRASRRRWRRRSG